MLNKQKDNKREQPRMNLVGERGQSNRLLVETVPVWYSRNGKVNPSRLSACEEERNLASKIVNHFEETAVHVSTYGGVRGQVAN